MEAVVKNSVNNIMRFFYLFCAALSTSKKRIPVDISEYIDVLGHDGLERDAKRLTKDWVKVGDEIEAALKEHTNEEQEANGQGEQK